MKRFLTILIAAGLAFSAAACEKKVDIPGDEPNEINNSADTENDAVESMTLLYGTDENEITIYKPEEAEISSPDQDGTDIITFERADLAWVMDVWGSVAYEHETGQPFVYYYYNGELDEYWSEEITSFDQEVRDLGFEFNGQPVKLIESRYIEADEDEEETDIFVGIEFEDTRNGEHYGNGLLGIQLYMYDEVPSDAEYAKLFKEVFGISK